MSVLAGLFDGTGIGEIHADEIIHHKDGTKSTVSLRGGEVPERQRDEWDIGYIGESPKLVRGHHE